MNLFKSSKRKISGLLILTTIFSTTLLGCDSDKNVEEVKQRTEVKQKENAKELKNDKGEKIITDMMNREVMVPTKVEKVFPAFFIANLAVYTLDPTLLVGRTFDPSKGSEKFLAEEYLQMPTVGTYMHGNDANEETIIEMKPDVIIYMGILNEQLKSKANETQEKLKIPVILVDASLDKMAESYRFLGKLLDREEKAEELAKYSENTMAMAEKVSKEISEDEKKSVFCALDGGTSTDPSGSIHAEIIDLVGGKNAAKLDSSAGYDRTEVSIEQILDWNPEVVITHKSGSVTGVSEGFYQEVFNKPEWENIRAIQDKEVYEIPNLPFNWYDMPPSVNRIIGIKWLGNLLYPDKYNLDMNKETKEFYKKFYHVELSDEDVDEILKNAKK